MGAKINDMIIDGRKIADEILADIKKEITGKNLKLRLAAILVGNDPEFEKFVELKGRAAKKIGVEFAIYQFSEEIETEKLAKRMREVSTVSDGILVELPLPKHIDQQKILNEIPIEKDVDVLSYKAQARFYSNLEAKLPSLHIEVEHRYIGYILPPPVEAVKMVFEKYNIEPKGKKVALFGYGFLVGKPVAYWLNKQEAEVSVIRSTTKNPGELSRQADIVITGVGKPGLVTGDMVKNGVVVIDFGYGKNSEGKMAGDVNFNSVSREVSLITPVPGGMGPILIAAVLKNLILLNS